MPDHNTHQSVQNKIETIGSTIVGRTSTLLFCLIVLAFLYDGWNNRHDNLITADSGVGYALGITGGSMMLIMLLYSARKRLKFMRYLGSVKHWFKMHMLFGVLGPCLILYHANFQLGSLNSNVALFCMLLVAASGLIGRYIYSRIHYSLYGSKASIEKLNEDIAAIKDSILSGPSENSDLVKMIESYERSTLRISDNQSPGVLHYLTISIKLLSFRIFVIRNVKRHIRKHTHINADSTKSIISAINTHFFMSRKRAELGFYERLFSLWHVIHIPFFLMMIISGVIHVIAVHMY